MSETEPSDRRNNYKNPCPRWKWLKTGAVILIVVLGLSSITLYASMPGFFHISESDTLLESYCKIGNFLKWPHDEQIGFIRRIAPEKFQDPSVPLKETARDLQHLNSALYSLLGMNASVDPCEDFYEFACGNEMWGNNSDGNFDDAAKELRSHEKEILDSWNVRSSHSRPMDLAVGFYNHCCNNSKSSTQDMEAFHKIMNILGGWPSLDPDWSDESFDLFGTIGKARRLYGQNPLFSVVVDLHPQNPPRNTIYLSPPAFSFVEDLGTASVENETAMEDYRAQYVRVVRQFSGKDDPGYESDASGVYNLERRLGMAVNNDSDGGSDNRFEIMTVEKFQLQMNNVNVTAAHVQISWTDLLNEIFLTSGISLRPDQEIIVEDMPFMRNLLKILDTSTPRLLANYMQWSLVRKWFSDVTKNMSTFHFNFSTVLGNVVPGQETAEEDSGSTCLSQITNLFAMPLCSEFVRRGYFSPSDRAAAHNMTTSIRESFSEVIRESDWISNFTRVNALKKIEGMTQFVGYPDWAMNDTRMEEEFRALLLDNNPVKSMANLVHWLSDRKLNSLNWDGRDLWSLGTTTGAANFPFTSIQTQLQESLLESTSETIDVISPVVVNAYNLERFNSILIPMGIIAPPFYFSSSAPASVNFGKLGWIIAHEIAHGFDILGSRFDAEGNPKEWLSAEDRENFETNAMCFVEQYDQYEIFPGKKINGSLTMDENIADNLGLQWAYRAYKRKVQHGELEQPKRLLGLEKLIPEQLFFLAYASSNCETASPEVLEQSLMNDGHSPSKYRVIGALQNSKEFAQAWSCPLGTPMNPIAKCGLW